MFSDELMGERHSLPAVRVLTLTDLRPFARPSQPSPNQIAVGQLIEIPADREIRFFGLEIKLRDPLGRPPFEQRGERFTVVCDPAERVVADDENLLKLHPRCLPSEWRSGVILLPGGSSAG